MYGFKLALALTLHYYWNPKSRTKKNCDSTVQTWWIAPHIDIGTQRYTCVHQHWRIRTNERTNERTTEPTDWSKRMCASLSAPDVKDQHNAIFVIFVHFDSVSSLSFIYDFYVDARTVVWCVWVHRMACRNWIFFVCFIVSAFGCVLAANRITQFIWTFPNVSVLHDTNA